MGSVTEGTQKLDDGFEVYTKTWKVKRCALSIMSIILTDHSLPVAQKVAFCSCMVSAIIATTMMSSSHS